MRYLGFHARPTPWEIECPLNQIAMLIAFGLAIWIEAKMLREQERESKQM